MKSLIAFVLAWPVVCHVLWAINPMILIVVCCILFAAASVAAQNHEAMKPEREER